MERPVSTRSEDIRDEKVKVLRAMPPIEIQDCVVGQYVGREGETGDEGNALHHAFRSS